MFLKQEEFGSHVFGHLEFLTFFVLKLLMYRR